MIYLALGDSISIDDYTSVAGGGAASQFASLLGTTEFHDLTRDGNTTVGVLASLETINVRPEIVTVTVGGNDLLQIGYEITRSTPLSHFGLPNVPTTALLQAANPILENLAQITARLSQWHCPVILNTVYDPTDGIDSLAEQLGIPAQWRGIYDQINGRIKTLAQEHDFLLCDLEALFHGHGIALRQPWLVMQIEPNFAGATAIAREWHRLYESSTKTEGNG